MEIVSSVALLHTHYSFVINFQTCCIIRTGLYKFVIIWWNIRHRIRIKLTVPGKFCLSVSFSQELTSVRGGKIKRKLNPVSRDMNHDKDLTVRVSDKKLWWKLKTDGMYLKWKKGGWYQYTLNLKREHQFYCERYCVYFP